MLPVDLRLTDEASDWLAELYLRKSAGMVAYACSLIHDQYQAEQAVQEAYRSISEILDKGEKKPCEIEDGYLVTTVKSKILDILRAEQIYAPLPEERVKPVQRAPWKRMEEGECAEALKAAVRLLPEIDRKLIAAYYGRGEREREIAAALGMSETNVSTRLSRARKKLRKMMDEMEATDHAGV